jgi:hypothetical protein
VRQCFLAHYADLLKRHPDSYRIRLLSLPFGFGSGEYQIILSHGGTDRYAWRGHEGSAFLVHDAMLYYLDYSPSTDGGALLAVDLNTGAIRWRKELVGVGFLEHTLYSNEVNLRWGTFLCESEGEQLVILGNEDGGAYIESIEARTGDIVFHRWVALGKIPRDEAAYDAEREKADHVLKPLIAGDWPAEVDALRRLADNEKECRENQCQAILDLFSQTLEPDQPASRFKGVVREARWLKQENARKLPCAGYNLSGIPVQSVVRVEFMPRPESPEEFGIDLWFSNDVSPEDVCRSLLDEKGLPGTLLRFHCFSTRRRIDAPYPRLR